MYNLLCDFLFEIGKGIRPCIIRLIITVPYLCHTLSGQFISILMALIVLLLT